jgi:DNA-binding NarL/FixJ family response regulator
MPGGTLIVSRAKNLFPYYQRRLLELGFKDVEATGEEKDSLNFVINEVKPRLVMVDSGFYHAGTPYMMGRLLKTFPKLNIAAVSMGEFPDTLAVWFIWHGVKSYVNFWEGYEKFHEGLQEIRKGNAYITRNVRRLIDLFPEWPQTRNKDIPKRQMETLVLLCNGFISEHIGNSMHVTGRTITTNLDKLNQTFHVKNREALVSMAWGLGIVTDKDMCFYDRKGDTGPLPEWAAAKKRMNKEVLTMSREQRAGNR